MKAFRLAVTAVMISTALSVSAEPERKGDASAEQYCACWEMGFSTILESKMMKGETKGYGEGTPAYDYCDKQGLSSAWRDGANNAIKKMKHKEYKGVCPLARQVRDDTPDPLRPGETH